VAVSQRALTCWVVLLVVVVACARGEDEAQPAAPRSPVAGDRSNLEAVPAASGRSAAGTRAGAGVTSSASRSGGAGSVGFGGREAVARAGAGAPASSGNTSAPGAGGDGGLSAGGASAAGAPSDSAADGGTIARVPSAGCAKANGRPASGAITQSDRIYSFPSSYDGKTPMPLLLGLHAAGNPNTQLQNLTKGSRLETSFVRVFPKSQGSAWVYSTDSASIKAVIDDVLDRYCVDTSHMFATGHSSGAQMVVQLLCNGDIQFKAVAPVAASKYCATVSPVAVLYIQGMMDAQRGGGNGADVVNVFKTSNACNAASTPVTNVATCMSTFDRMQVTPGCVRYEGCTVPTMWCSHNDNGYNATDGHQHGWPCFASEAIADFFLTFP
jgi:polyhydroxybutyrate depolymerase